MNQIDNFITQLASCKIQLWLDGERLRYKAPPGAMTPEIVAELKQNKAAIISVLKDIALEAASKVAPIKKIPRTEQLPLSLSQEAIWLQNQLEPNNPIDNMPYVYRFQGKLDLALFEQSQNEIIRRHEILRSTFPLVNGKPIQKVTPALTLPIHIIDLQQIPPSAREAEARSVANRESCITFNLATGPLLRISMLQLREDDFIAVVNIHRIICDGTSAGILFRELVAIYQALAAGKPLPLAELPVQYVDYAAWERGQRDETAIASELARWKEQLGDNLATLNLPTDRLRPPRATFKGARQYAMLPVKLNQGLNNLGRESDCTLFMVLIAALNVLLHRYTNNDDIVVSFSHSGRTQVELERLIGIFTRTLPIRTRFPQQISFRELLATIRKSVLWADEHSSVPFGRLIQEFKSKSARSPLLQIIFALNPPWKGENSLSSIELDGLKITSLFGYVYIGQTKFDLSLVMRETDLGLRTVLEYNQDLFDESTIVSILEHWQILLAGIVANPDLPVSELPLLTTAEQKLLQDLNHASLVTSTKQAIHRVFEEKVKQNPEAIAIMSVCERLTYRELNQKANQLAHYLQSLGLKSGAYVGVYLPRSSEAIISFLAILKLGGVCVPLTSQMTTEEKIEIFKNTQFDLFLTRESLRQTMPMTQSCKVICGNEEWEIISQKNQSNLAKEILSESLAYVLYELRQDNERLGVKFSHQAIAQNSDAFYFNCQLGTRVLQHSPYDSNLAMLEIWGALLNGSSLTILPAMIKQSETLADFIRESKLSCLSLPVRLFNYLATKHPASLKSLERIVVVGERLSLPVVHQWLQREDVPELTFLYNAPENPAITAYVPSREEENFTLGKPVPNSTIQILDRYFHPVPIGVVGDLYIGGDNLASGYLNCSELTEQRFIRDSFGSEANARLFKTGDKACYLSDGSLVKKARGDRQISLNEIERIIEQHQAIAEVYLELVPQDSEVSPYIAYLVLQKGASITPAQLHDFLKEKIPAYAIPSSFIDLTSLPLDEYGIVDSNRLSQASPRFLKIEAETVRNFNSQAIEGQLIEIWQELLGIDLIGITDNFFELGGNSLLAVNLFTLIEEKLGKSLPLSTLLQAPTIRELARSVEKARVKNSWSPLVKIKTGDNNKIPLFCIHGGGFNVLIYRKLAENLDSSQPVYGLQGREINKNQPIAQSIQEMAADYIEQIQQVQPQGPYLLCGLSNGGNIALEMSQQLKSQGEKVALLAMFDCLGPDASELLPPLPRFISSIHYGIRFSLPRWTAKQSSLDPIKTWQQLRSGVRSIRQNRSSKPSAVNSSSANLPEISSERAAQKSDCLTELMNRISQYILLRSPWSFYERKQSLRNIESSITKNLEQMDSHYNKLHKSYLHRPYAGKITLFRAGEFPPGYRLETKLGWGKIALEGVEIYRIPGHHTSIVSSPTLAKKLATCIAKAL